MASFSETAWAANAGLYETIRTMGFNEELAAGTLRLSAFRHYMIQDAHYLEAFGRGLAVAAAKADTSDAIVQFAEAAKVAIIDERELHEAFFARFGIDAGTVAATPPSPACHHYASFLIATCWAEPYPVALAALLPCFWIYAEIGRDIHARAAPGNPYRAWIDTYAGEDFHAAVRAVIATTDEVAARQTDETLAAMHLAFTRATQLEWMFWDSAHKERDWPVG